MYCRAVFRGELPSLILYCIAKLNYEFQLCFYLKNFHSYGSDFELVLKMFLNFGQFEPRYSYKVVLIKNAYKTHVVKVKVHELSFTVTFNQVEPI